MILEKNTAVRNGRVHDGKVIVMRSDIRRCSDGLELTVTDRLLPRRFRFEAGDELLVVDKAVEEVVPFVG